MNGKEMRLERVKAPQGATGSSLHERETDPKTKQGPASNKVISLFDRKKE
jgi:hypothetical protein